ncbi:MAG TPA: hypothetical protein DCE42_26240 [Myxococcales bacterium]|nr:hypothetical protein [Deltaproteobacteria bacterium]HAA58290.1 hypothetical protein [Myxococcales bacterium]|tara:strand:- start:1895 stop:2113 length:219 start_codon:yes stop_codon:yes gene_type:complete
MKEESFTDDTVQERPPRPDRARKAVYTIVESKSGKSIWTKLGIAYVNRDHSLNVFLEGFPVNGQLHIRDFPE